VEKGFYCVIDFIAHYMRSIFHSITKQYK